MDRVVVFTCCAATDMQCCTAKVNGVRLLIHSSRSIAFARSVGNRFLSNLEKQRRFNKVCDVFWRGATNWMCQSKILAIVSFRTVGVAEAESGLA